MLLQILNNRQLALKYIYETSSKYTKINQVNNYFCGIISLAFLCISNFLDFYILILSPLYIVCTMALNILDYRVRKEQLKKLIE